MMAQDVEVAPSFQPLLGLAANFLGSHESQVADPMIEAIDIAPPFPVFADLGYGHQVPSERREKDVFSAFLHLRPEGHFDGDVFLRVSSRCFQHQMAFAPTRFEGACGQFRADHNAYASLLPEAERGVGQERNNGSTRKFNSRFWSRNRPPLSVPRLRYPPAPPYQT